MTDKQYSGVMMLLWLIVSYLSPWQMAKIGAAVVALLFATNNALSIYIEFKKRGAA